MSLYNFSSRHNPTISLTKLSLEDFSLKKIINYAANQPSELIINGSSNTQALTILSLSQFEPLLVVTATDKEAKDLATELYDALGESTAILPSWGTLPYELLSPEVEIIGARLLIFYRLFYPHDETMGPPLRVITTPIKSLLQPISSNLLKINPIGFKIGTEIDFKLITNRLIELAYTHVDFVSKQGEFATRNRIIDVFPCALFKQPIRIIFKYNKIYEISVFSVNDQRSIKGTYINKVVILPCSEMPITTNLRKKAKLIQIKSIKNKSITDKKLSAILDKLIDGASVNGMESFVSSLNLSAPTTITQFMPKGMPIILCNYSKINDKSKTLIKTGEDFFKSFCSTTSVNDQIRSDIKFSKSYSLIPLIKAKEIAENYGNPWWILSQLNNKKSIKPNLKSYLTTQRVYKFFESMYTLRLTLSLSGKVTILTSSSTATYTVLNRLSRCNIPAIILQHNTYPKIGIVGVILGKIRESVLLSNVKLMIVKENYLNNKNNSNKEKIISLKSRKTTLKNAKISLDHHKIINPVALKSGDLVVHDKNGIGKFIEIEERVVGKSRREYIVLEYASSKTKIGTNRLYIPTDSIYQLSRYVGSEVPSLSKLGSDDWTNAKTKARKKIKQIANNLISLYAKRQTAVGYAFMLDTPWQSEMENAFSFKETEDQLKTVSEVKLNMENSVSMDRIICGDVGYGKTEIAIRIAFKAVQDSKQVVILVPTTLLVDQHLQSFKSRMQGFPVNIKGISRFTSQSNFYSSLESIKDGKLDIVIGTHRLLQKKVIWNNLGLAIVDEEQRFGVEHKEYIKSISTNIDVITMSATPIPRSLEMGLVGIKKISTVMTPPEDRFPVLTYIGPYNDIQIIAALRRELARKGQIFYIHNRISTIDIAATRIQNLLPEIRVIVAHGRMNEEILERIFKSFWNHEYDVLVCTTIIENGLDISNVNTLIVENSNCFGLSQLYQLRGRIGRSNKRSYAYFLYSANMSISDINYDRLSIIAQNNELGVGIAVAIKDLEIRGAGSLVGTLQSGHTTNLGFELYIRLVNEVIKSYKNTAIKETKDSVSKNLEVRIELPISAYLPSSYISSNTLRLEGYKLLSTASSKDMVLTIVEEFIDRYGKLPDSAHNLVLITQLKLLCRKYGIRVINTISKSVIGLSPVVLTDYEQIRLKRIYPNSRYQASNLTLKTDIPNGIYHINSSKERDLAIIKMVTDFVTLIYEKL